MLMHSSHVSARYDYSIRTQSAEAGSSQVQRGNEAIEERAKGGGSYFYLIMTLGGNAVMKSRVTLRQPSLKKAYHPSHGSKSGQSKISSELPYLGRLSESLSLPPTVTE